MVMRKWLYCLFAAPALWLTCVPGDVRAAESQAAVCVPIPKLSGDRSTYEKYRREIEALEKSGAPESSLADPVAGLAYALLELAEFDQSEQAFARAIALRERSGRTTDVQYVELLKELGARQRVAGK